MANHLLGQEGQFLFDGALGEVHRLQCTVVHHAMRTEHDGVVEFHIALLDHAAVTIEARQIEHVLELSHGLVADQGRTGLASGVL